MARYRGLKPSFNSCSCLNSLYLSPALKQFSRCTFFSILWKFIAVQSLAYDVWQCWYFSNMELNIDLFLKLYFFKVIYEHAHKHACTSSCYSGNYRSNYYFIWKVLKKLQCHLENQLFLFLTGIVMIQRNQRKGWQVLQQ